MSPALEEKLAFTATLVGSYEAAAQVAGKWGCPVDDSVIHALVQRVGQQGRGPNAGAAQASAAGEPTRSGGASEVALLMVDGWFARFRGPGWGKKKTKQERVEWHEIKNGVFYLHEQAARTEGGRGVIADKVVVRSQGTRPMLGQRLHWEALRGGLGRAKEKLVLGDGIAWIWNLKANRWPEARELLDFWHGGQHLWNLGRACNGMDEAKAKPWVEKRLAPLAPWAGTEGFEGDQRAQSFPEPGGQIVRKEKNYFAGHAQPHELQRNC